MKFVRWFLRSSLVTKIVCLSIIVGLGWFSIAKLTANRSKVPQYQTARVEKGTLIVSITGSGTISSANSATVTTQTSGVVKKLFVENGALVKSGDPIAEVDLDMDGKQRAAQALASYQNAKNSLDSANATYYSLQSALFTQWKTYTDIAKTSTYQNSDGSANSDNRILTPFTTAQDDWLAAEAKFKNQQGVIAQAQTSVNSAWASYNQASPTIYAPITGTLSGLSLQVGSVLTAQTGSSGNSTAQRIANIKTTATPTVSVSLTEVDAPKVKIGNKATITMDALPGKSYTGKVISVDTTGTVSSGVTSYLAVIKLDTGGEEIFPNMSAQVNIITTVKDNALIVPTAAVQNQGGQPSVRIMQKGSVVTVNVDVGSSSTTQTEILSGVSEGDTIITSINNAATNTPASSQTRSVFGGGGFGGGVFRGGR
ncbi:HlyD family efflux transporter periplasmic adaptor subunit [Candidatus Gottesmanbacteria bacterium]|nr:HlyD family efflux transporter periplasmic adaptor subunit [Candidatus Gottesmanbacteria bacterium]